MMIFSKRQNIIEGEPERNDKSQWKHKIKTWYWKWKWIKRKYFTKIPQISSRTFTFTNNTTTNILVFQNEITGSILSVYGSGLRYLGVYSLLGGGVPNPEHRLSRSLDSVSIFSLLWLPLAIVLVPPYPPSKIHPGSLPSSAFCPYPVSSFLLPPFRPFLCRRPSTSSSVCHPSSVRWKSTTLRLNADQMPSPFVLSSGPKRVWTPPPRPVRLVVLSLVLGGGVKGWRRRRPPRWSWVSRRIDRRRPG